MTTVENQPISRGYKYVTVEEAEEVNRRNMKEWKIKNKEEYNKYQREYQRKQREKKKLLEQQNAVQQQQLLMYQQLMYQQSKGQQDNNVNQSSQANVIVTSNFVLEIVN
jgi:hypothetical protein